MLLIILRIQGHSMVPSFNPKDVIIATSLSYLFSSPKVGDVVTFKDNNNIIVKRIVKIENDQYFIQGDNARDSKSFEPIGRREIIGKVILKI